jgi:stearoyl-CoA desaturase (delta-9 desaturase)
MLIIDLVLFGWWGLLIWGIQMIWIPFFAAGVINGIGHYWGYRNGETRDQSRNIVPIGILIGGEELHNSHHLDPANPRFSRNWWEFDIGWMYIRILCWLRLARTTQNVDPTASS